MKKIVSLIAIIFTFALFCAFVTGCDLAAAGDGTTTGSADTSTSTVGTTSADIITQGTTTTTTATTQKTTAKTTTVTTKVTTKATTTATTKVTTKATTKATTATTVAPKNITIFLDPGHGGSDGGTSREYNGTTYKESDINLAVALEAKKALEKRGYTVVLSRETDTKVSLNDRAPMAQEANAAMFISIHVNSYGEPGQTKAAGAEVYYTGRDGLKYNARDFAKYFAEEFEDICDVPLSTNPSELAYPNMKVRGVKCDEDLYGNGKYLAVLNPYEKEIPSVLIELGFITNDNDLMMLKSPWWQIYAARAIADAVDTAYADGVYAK